MLCVWYFQSNVGDLKSNNFCPLLPDYEEGKMQKSSEKERKIDEMKETNKSVKD